MSLRPTSAKKVVKILSKLGFRVVRTRGSHVVMKHVDGRITVVPVHAGEELGCGILGKIAKDTGLTKEEFIKLVNAS